MADNVSILDGTGNQKTVAADEVTDLDLGTVEVQFAKLMDGALNGTTKATVGPFGLESQDRPTGKILEEMLVELREIKWLLADKLN